MLGPLMERHREQMKPEAIEEIEAGARVTGADIARAMAKHVAVMTRVATFQQRYDVLATVVSQVPPFNVELTWPRAIAGVAMAHYVEWMKSAYLVSATWCPSISVPAAFTAPTRTGWACSSPNS